MFKSLWEGLFVVLLWIGLWDLIEMGVDFISSDYIPNKVFIYVVIVLLSAGVLYYYIYNDKS